MLPRTCARMYAKIIVGLPIEGPFDYEIPPPLAGRVHPGSRVWVQFGYRRMVGFVVGLSPHAQVLRTKPLLALIDEVPLCSPLLRALSRKVAGYYCCSWAEALETALPEGLRKGRPVPASGNAPSPVLPALVRGKRSSLPLLIHDYDGHLRQKVYLEHLQEALSLGGSALYLCGSHEQARESSQWLRENFSCPLELLYRGQPKEDEVWLRVRHMRGGIVVGTRSTVFAPLEDARLIILDDEDDATYKQDQVPHYQSRQVAFMRSQLQGCRVVLGSSAPSLHSMYLVGKKKMDYTRLARATPRPQVRLIDMKQEWSNHRQQSPVSRFLVDLIHQALGSGQKALLFVDRRGFATSAVCRNCGLAIQCPRCAVNLIYHFNPAQLRCHYCNFTLPPPQTCPHCQKGYLRYSGSGSEKIASELSRLFPQARIHSAEHAVVPPDAADIVIATQGTLWRLTQQFPLVGVISVDSSLIRAELSAAEKTFGLLVRLWQLASQRMVIQTSIPTHHVYTVLAEESHQSFYAQELSQRRQTGFPPYTHLGLVRIRGVSSAKVRDASQRIFEYLGRQQKPQGLRILSCNPAIPAQLRGKYYWQVVCRCGTAEALCRFLKTHLSKAAPSGIIVTVDIDPA